jgi:phenylacetate-CoA ligase
VNGFGFKSEGDYREAQDRKLRHFLRRQVQPYSPHYRAVFERAGVDVESIEGVADLPRIPFTSKQDLLATPERPEPGRDFILQPTAELLKRYATFERKALLLRDRVFYGADRARRRIEREYRPIFMTATTGRSARPVPFLYTLYDIEILKTAGSRIIDTIAVGTDAKTINLFPYAPHLAFWQVQMAGFAHGVMVVGTGGGRVTGTEGSIQLIERLGAEVIVGVPSYVYHLLRRAVRQRADFSRVKRVVLGAEKLAPGMKDKVREALQQLGATDVVVLGTYGFTEARMAFAESPYVPGGGYVLSPDLGVFEIVDPVSGERLPDDADGELVYTPVDGRGTVVLRYRTGDLVKGGIVPRFVKELGGWLPVLSPDISRASNIREMDLRKVKGTLIDFNDLSTLLSGMPEIEEWQVVIRKKDDDPYEVDEMAVYVATREGLVTSNREFQAKLADEIRLRCEVQPNEIEIQSLDELVGRLGLETEMKEKRIVDLRPKK